MKHKKYYDIVQEILEAFKIETLPREIDIDGMAEDMCTADDATQIRMIGIFLYFAVYGDERCSDIGNLSMFLSYSFASSGRYFRIFQTAENGIFK